MSKSWAELQLTSPREELDSISSLLFDIGALGLQEDYLPGQAPPPLQPWESGPSAPLPPNVLIRAWFEMADKPEINEKIKGLVLMRGISFRWATIDDSNWGESWKENFSRHVFSDALAISPPWLAQSGDLIIEPGVAFGTGEHPTTASCLKAIAEWSQPGKTCLDIGCGSGILALAAAKLGMTSEGIDIDKDAVLSARATAKNNKMNVAFSTTPLEKMDRTYDVVVANLFAELLIKFAPMIMARCSERLALAGILHDRVEGVLRSYSEMRLIQSRQEGDWISLWYAK